MAGEREELKRGSQPLQIDVCNSNRSQRPAKILKPVETFFDDVDAGGVAEPHRSIVTERRARHDSHVCLA